MHQTFLTVDLGFGDAGKGSVVDFLSRTYAAHTVVRFNGGAQAGHRVVTPDGLEHVFSQFGAGALAGAATHLSRFMIMEPLAMLAEAAHLRSLGVADPFAQTSIDVGALVITPFGRAINRLRELARGAGRHGSCGIGVGETVADALAQPEMALRAGDLVEEDRLYAKLKALRDLNLAKLATIQADLPANPQSAAELELLLDPDWADWLLPAYTEFTQQARLVSAEHLHRILRRPGTVIFEAAQGVLLDEWRGFHPHTTWSTTTLQNAERLLAEADYLGRVQRIGITRAYATRHGAGPLPSEDATLSRGLPDACNQLHLWQQHFRIGWLDLVLLRYAKEIVGHLDGLAVTCLDRLADLDMLQICQRYQLGPLQIDRIIPASDPHDLTYQSQITAALHTCQPVLEPLDGPDALLQRVAETLGVPVWLTSYGPRASDKVWQL
ncbi:Adenylosuccinate synthase [Oscillochloris trichoides DG-6]|uniref:Adenylosuccinate synthetase n=1 Tax=Oscillochloris trichoides DG-6 TaxID=765420 RepID=E1ICZ4_9CHLR|nr:adenylosuccinate synthetase [Oscillochloris trichoides]EFO80964.1 Adenylosuccinate synthase [Oscillochloris trichoides DG-6]